MTLTDTQTTILAGLADALAGATSLDLPALLAKLNTVSPAALNAALDLIVEQSRAAAKAAAIAGAKADCDAAVAKANADYNTAVAAL